MRNPDDIRPLTMNNTRPSSLHMRTIFSHGKTLKRRRDVPDRDGRDERRQEVCSGIECYLALASGNFEYGVSSADKVRERRESFTSVREDPPYHDPPRVGIRVLPIVPDAESTVLYDPLRVCSDSLLLFYVRGWRWRHEG